MAKIGFSKLLVILALHFSLPSLAKEEREPPFRINIGYFNFPLKDPEIESRVHQVEHNVSSWEHLFTLASNYWRGKAQALPNDEEIKALRQLGHETKVDDKELETLLEHARISYDDTLSHFNNDSQRLWDFNQTDLAEKFLLEIEDEFNWLHHQWLVSFAGVGSAVDCSAHVNTMLDQMTEWEKSGMAAASTLMALLPTFLAFGSLFVPRSSEAFATSWLIGLGAALFSLGLPVRSLSCVRRKQVLELATLDKDPLDGISELGAPDPDSADPRPTLEDLQQWTQEKPPQRYMRDFGRIREAVDQYKERWHWWHVPAILIAACQATIFGLAVEPLLKAAGIPKFLFGCSDTNWTGLYLSASAGGNAILRLIMWQLCDHEVVQIFHLSDETKRSLEVLKQQARQLPNMQTTATNVPPLYPPLISRFHTNRGRFIKKFFSTYQPLEQEHPHSALLQPIHDQFDYIKFIFRNPVGVLRSGFANTDASPRWRPLVVLIHLSTTGRPQLRTLFTGFCEASLLLALTFFFASQWGGNLYITGIALALLLVFITTGRALAIAYVWLSARTWGLHTIDCDDQAEILGCLRIVCSMQGVLVTVNGGHYYDGYRLDYVPEFKKWQKDYAQGRFDAVKTAVVATKSGVADGNRNGPEKKDASAVQTATLPVGQDVV